MVDLTQNDPSNNLLKASQECGFLGHVQNKKINARRIWKKFGKKEILICSTFCSTVRKSDYTETPFARKVREAIQIL